MHQPIFRYLVFALTVLTFMACRQAKYVAEENYLNRRNTVHFVGMDKNGDTALLEEYGELYVSEMYDLIKPIPNKGTKLFFYNRIDTVKHQEQLDRKHAHYESKNAKRKKKEEEINARRIEKAREKGKDYYKQKVKRMKEERSGWRDWVRVHMGQAPVLYDTTLVEKSRKQLEIYMVKRGYYHAEVRDSVYFKEKKQKAFVHYIVEPGEPVVIDTFELGADVSANLAGLYKRFVKAKKSVIVQGSIVDEDILNLERENFTKYCRDEGAYFGFNKNFVSYELDTLNGRGNNAKLIMHVSDKEIKVPGYEDSVVYVPHQTYYVKSVTFLLHNPKADTISFRGRFAEFEARCNGFNLGFTDENQDWFLLDTLVNIDTLFLKGGKTEVINKGVFVYNFEPFLEPDLIDKQNFLYIPHYAKEYYLERTYRTMLQLDVFSSITPIVEVDPANPFGNQVNVTYHLVPSKRQTFTLEPQLTNTNSVLGVMGSIDYVNKNLARGAQKLKVSFTGGFESQPVIVDETTGDASNVRSFNTFEWGPIIELSFPKLVPLPKKAWDRLSKRAYPLTKFELAVNIQKRDEFRRRLAHFSYEWNFKWGKTNEMKWKFVNFDFVRLLKTQEFIDKLAELDDPFLINSYADHFSLFNGVTYRFTNQLPNEYDAVIHDFQFTILQAGALLNATGWGTPDLGTGLKNIFGVPFSQFVRIDNQYLLLWKINKKHKIANRLMAGAGFAYGNSPSLPYEQSFTAGGSNDIRAFAARTMAPGSIRIFEDSTATLTQIGDMRLEFNTEYRFYINNILEGAIFVDMGNIWKLQDDLSTPDDDLGVFKFGTFWKQVAIGTGFGIRADFDFLIVRADFAFPLHNPYLPAGERWFLTPHPTYRATWDLDGDGTIESGDSNGSGGFDSGDETWFPYHRPFALKFNFGIGYTF